MFLINIFLDFETGLKKVYNHQYSTDDWRNIPGEEHLNKNFFNITTIYTSERISTDEPGTCKKTRSAPSKQKTEEWNQDNGGMRNSYSGIF